MFSPAAALAALFLQQLEVGRNFETYPQSKTSTIGEPTCCPEEALLWQRSESPVCRKKKKCAGGSLMGQNHEALCGEARKVSQRSTAAAQETAQSPSQGKRNGEWRREETRHHHGGEKWGSEELGTALKGQCIESMLLPRGHRRRSPGLHRKRPEEKGGSSRKRIDGEKEWFWFREKNQQLQQERPRETDDQPIQGNGDDM